MTTRRTLLALVAGLMPAAAWADAAPVSKSAVGYQDVPNNGQVCAQCVYFEFKPEVNGQPASRCKMVAGVINPAGWCQIFAPK